MNFVPMGTMGSERIARRIVLVVTDVFAQIVLLLFP